MKVEPGKWRSLEGKRQMRVTPSAYNHVVTKNVHVPLDIGNKGCR